MCCFDCFRPTTVDTAQYLANRWKDAKLGIISHVTEPNSENRNTKVTKQDLKGESGLGKRDLKLFADMVPLNHYALGVIEDKLALRTRLRWNTNLVTSLHHADGLFKICQTVREL